MFTHHSDTEVATSFRANFSLCYFAQTQRRCGEKILIVFVFLCIALISLQAETVLVKPHQSIQSAINNAKAGDRIEVQAGSYNENLTLDKTIILEGVNKPILRGTGKGSTLIVNADNCVVKGFVVEHCGGDLQQEDSGILLRSNHNRVEYNELRDILYGIYLYKSQSNTIAHNFIRGRSELEAGDRGAGLHLWNSPNNTICDNEIVEARDGLYIQSSPGNFIHHNRAVHLRYGLHFMSSDDNKFEDNIFSDNVAGAAIMYSRRIELRRNAFIRNRGFSSFGILFQDCDDCITEENFIINNACGVFLEALRKSRFRNNVIAENDVAMQIFSSSDNCEFSNNNFIENLSPLQLVGINTNTKWQQNFWSDYEGYDLDTNGIGDVPHKVQNVFEYLEGNFPRLRIYLNSPAAQALATAERTFPIIKGSSLTDSSPRIAAQEFHSTFATPETQRFPQILLAAISLLSCGIAFAVTIAMSRKGQRA